MQFNAPTRYAPPAAADEQQANAPTCAAGRPCVVRTSNKSGRQFWGCQCKPFCEGWIGWVDETPASKPRAFKRAAAGDEEEPRQIKRANAATGAEIEAAAVLASLESRIDALADQLRESTEHTHAFLQAIEAQLQQRRSSIH